MLPNVEFRLRPVILQIVTLQIRLVPVHGEKLILKIGVISGPVHRDVFDQIPQFFTDVFKLVDARPLQIVGVENLMEQVALCHDSWNVGYSGDALHLFHQVLPSP